jgi:hypothetical protein
MLLAGAFVLAPEPWSFSPRNGTRLGWPGYKVDAQHAVAEIVARETPADGLILAPAGVAVWIPTLSEHPRVVAIRPHYLRVIAYARGKHEASKRRLLLRSVDASDPWPARGLEVQGRLPEIARHLDELGVSTVVLGKDLAWRAEYAGFLRRAGFGSRDLGAYELWVREPSNR